MRVSVPACGVPARGRYFHRGDVDTAPFAVTSGDMTPESSESGSISGAVISARRMRE
uniref:Uncharacterized protein n=1 Tax=Klebsiella pneumoniae TaxID=573 RepID=A0A2P1BNJ8_KLEPN|nr:hypothetical protein [Klebsiella pneumoniae]